MDLFKTLDISAAGMKVQGVRLRVIAENIANAESTGNRPNEDPYRRRVVTFGSELDRALGVEKVAVRGVKEDSAGFGMRHDPSHPAADEQGYVKTPNVNALIELNDMRQAQRSYEANLRVQQISRSMLEQAINMLR